MVLKLISLTMLITFGLSLNIAKTEVISSQNDLIKTSERLRLNELELRNLEVYKNLLKIQKEQKEKQLLFYKKEISKNIISLYKLNTSSLKLLLYSDQSKKNALASYSLLTYYNNFIKGEIVKANEYISLIKNNTKESKVIEQKIIKNNKEIIKNTEAIKNYAKDANANNIENIEKIKISNLKLIKESENLAHLIRNLNKKIYIKSDIKADKKILKEKGKFVWPNAGFLESAFQKNKNQIYKNGIVILSLPNSQIVSPFDGQILFVDNFEKLNTIIIIKHSPRLYSIISGVINPIVSQLQLVKKHEPIALSDNKLSSLYYEVKYNEEPSNPMIWLQKRKQQ